MSVNVIRPAEPKVWLIATPATMTATSPTVRARSATTRIPDEESFICRTASRITYNPYGSKLFLRSLKLRARLAE